ncbi:ArsR/SmtB family transcription factor [Martelella alba]|uniref:Metalloregulator ArsR/SmtB family transcription factor n=1 Tax=Martelella alba TaxID=2590451 RepID=A0ABY2SET4_9HYPH|nr:metalloregulator ArsR/SmtB family transcription factor [Martelella alba]TKI03061.1 metalloregulator ArsR/SmtB family transcription factor [Martelella alba]
MNSELNNEHFEKIAEIAKAFSNGRRLQLIELLYHGEKSVELMSTILDAGITSVSAHLQILKSSGIVKSRKEGKNVFYRISDDSVMLLLDNLKKIPVHIHFGEGDTYQRLLPNISLGEFIQRFESKDAVIVDVRPKDEFCNFHIPGAISVPIDKINEWASSYYGKTDVIVYCRGIYCILSSQAVSVLNGKGINAYIYQNGISEWRTAGLPVITNAV